MDDVNNNPQSGRHVMNMNTIQVECYAGYRGQQRPLRFSLAGHVYQVTRVEDQWYSPSALYFRVQADDGHVYVLRYDQGQMDWTLSAFRRKEVERPGQQNLSPPKS